MSRKKQKHHSNHERWLISYADFITLLFAFFVVLYATSKADQKKQAQVAAAINSAFQALGLFQSVDKTKGAQVTKDAASALADAQSPEASLQNVNLQDQLIASPAVQQDFERMKRRLEGVLSKQLAEHVVALHIGQDGLVITLREAGFYDSGSAVPHPDSIKTLNEITEILRATPYDIRIEGHTDNVPIHTQQFDSNWELSTARATYMTKLFIINRHFAPLRLSASGYAEFHPTTSNATVDGRALNRRVDIIVLPKVTPQPAPSMDMSRAKPASLTAALPATRAEIMPHPSALR
jgi:chemotaxis protein MotB